MKRVIIFCVFLTACRGEFDASDEGISESDENDSSDMGDSNCGSACETGGSTTSDGSSDSDSTSTAGDGTGNTNDSSDTGSTTQNQEETGTQEEDSSGSSETGQVDLPQEAYCNPWLDTCALGLTCTRHGAPNQNDQYFFWCIPGSGGVPKGGQCVAATDCAQGHECLSKFSLPDATCDFDFCCTPLCAKPNGPDCPMEYPKCQIMNLDFLDEYPFEEVGHCLQ